jgi:hypothetical protein
VTPLEHLTAHGWAALGRVADEAVLVGLRQRSDELMLGSSSYVRQAERVTSSRSW